MRLKKSFFFIVIFFNPYTFNYAQLLPANETQVNVSSYFDNFNVTVLYPSISMTKHLSESTSITGRYLVDMITAASIRSKSPGGSNSGDGGGEGGDLGKVDAVTAATPTSGGSHGDGGPTFDEVRHEFNLGFAHVIGGSLFSFDGLYSKESDYTSSTLIGNYTQYLAENNTSFQLGIVRSWDRIYPKTKSWTKDKNVTTLNANFSQVLSKNFILQLLSSYSDNNGLLSDNYMLVPISISGKDSLFDPIHPSLRIRRAAAVSLKYRLNQSSSLQTGYRYYWDSWNLNASTYSADYQLYLSRNVIMDAGWRGNFQTQAFFFKPIYTSPEEYMTTDIKLDAGYSNEFKLDFILMGGHGQDTLPFLDDERVQYIFNIDLYFRHTNSPYWFNNKNDLSASNFNIGIRYRY